MGFEPHVAGLFVMTTGIGALMMLAGVGKHALEWRRRRRVCPSCGRGQVVLVSEIVTHDPDVPSRDTWECRDCLHTWETAVAG